MRKRTRLLGVGAIAIVSALAMAACSPTDSGSGAPEPVVFWGSWSGDQVAQLDAQAAAFNESQDEYEVTYVPQELVEEKLLTAIAGGQVPDVILWDRPATMTYAPKGALAEIDEFVARDGVDLDGFYEQALNEMYSADKLYGLPLLVDNRSLFYNRTLLAEAGVEPPTTWDELKTAAEALTVRDGGILTRSGFALNDPGLFASWLRQAGGTMLNDDQTEVAFNSPEGLEVLAFWKSLLEAGVYEQGFGDGIDAFAESSLAMKFDGPWALSGLDQTDVDYGIVSPPAGPNGDQGAGMGGFGLVIAEGAKNPEGAWAFMKWWTTEPANGVGFAKIAGWIPANIEAANDPYFTDNDHYAAFIETLEFAQTRPQVPGYSDVEGLALIPSLQKFLSGELTAEAALAEAETLSNQILADNR
jgi:multiple sugar transport system substrate-binding protein